MCGHRREGINERCAVLYGQTFNCVAVVACPGLRHIVEHTAVKASAAARAGFEQNVGEIGHQTFKQAVKPEVITVGDLLLSVGGQVAATDLAHITVEVPFHI